jgi:hypothetical protein
MLFKVSNRLHVIIYIGNAAHTLSPNQVRKVSPLSAALDSCSHWKKVIRRGTCSHTTGCIRMQVLIPFRSLAQGGGSVNSGAYNTI